MRVSKAFIYFKKDQFSITCALWIGRPAEVPVFSQVEWEERVSNERESFIVLVVLFVLFSGLVSVRESRKHFNPCLLLLGVLGFPSSGKQQYGQRK